jgi:hypothetical protein
MDQEAVALIGAITIVMLVFFILPFIAIVIFSKKRMKAYEEAAALRRKHPSKNKRITNNLEADYTWRRWKVTYIIVALLVAAGVFIGASAYNNQRVCESWSMGDINGTTVFDRYRSGTTCKTLAERSEGINAAGLTALVAIILVAGRLALPRVYRYTSPGK